MPLMLSGNKPTDGGNLILSSDEQEEIRRNSPSAARYIKKLLGSAEFIRGTQRWCLWIEDDEVEAASYIAEIKERVEKVKAFRSNSKAASTRNFKGGSHRFIQIQRGPTHAVIIPEVSSERRMYIPMGFCDSNTVLTNKIIAIYDADSYIFGLLISQMHMAWVSWSD